MDQSKLKNVWSYTRVFTVWTRTLTFSPDRIFKTEYRLFCFRGFPQYLKVNAQTISRLGITASLQILPNLSSSIHLNIDATENETRPSYNKPQKEPECTLYTNCMRKCYTSYSKIFITRKIHAKAYQSPFSDDVHICCIAISYKLHLSMWDSRLPKVVLIKIKVFWAMNPVFSNSSGRFERFAAYICRAI